MRFSNIIFDLDGTLIDSLPGIEHSAQQAVAQCLPDRTLPPMRDLIGPPIRTMFARLWPDLGDVQLATLVIAFRSHYDSIGCLTSPLYPDVLETLGRLRDAGASMFVLTNKPSLPTRLIVEEHGVSAFFKRTVSPDSQTPPFAHKAAGAEFLRSEFALVAADTIVIGDGADDHEAAQRCGFHFAIAGYGYGSAAAALPPDQFLTLKTFSEIANLVL